MKREARRLQRTSTGDIELDALMGGGIPDRSVVMVGGEPGSGKTILTLQMLFSAARRGERCLYLTTLSEPAVKLIRYMQLFEFFDPALLEKKIVFADLGAALREGPTAALDTIAALVEKHDASLVAIDSFRAMGDLLGEAGLSRTFIYELAVRTATWGATSILVGEYARDEVAKLAEFAIADGIVFLGSERHELTSVRELELVKMRGADFVTGKHFCEITSAGLAVYPRVRAPGLDGGRPARPAERCETGVEGLDELLDGGLPRGSTTVLQGGTGTGKTLLGLQFLLEGARAGEKGILFAQEETPEQLRGIAKGLGWDLAAFEARDLLKISYASPVEMSTDRYLHQARHEVAKQGARRAVFDSLTTMALGVPSERRFKEMVYAIAKHMYGMNVTVLMTVETEQLLGSAVLSGHGVSFIADNLIQLRYLEIEGRLERAISVLKARGVKHSSELRSLTIAPEGLRVVGDRFKDMRGVLTGLPTRATGGPGGPT